MKHTEGNYGDLDWKAPFSGAYLSFQGSNMKAKRRKVIKSLLSIGLVPGKGGFPVLVEVVFRSRFIAVAMGCDAPLRSADCWGRCLMRVPVRTGLSQNPAEIIRYAFKDS